MALLYVGGSSGGGTGSTYSVSLTSLTGGAASAPIAGDLVVVVTGFSQISDGNPGVTAPSGYTELADLYANDNADANLSVNYKIQTATPDTSVTVTGPNSTAYGGGTVVHVWRGANSTTPIDVTITTATGTNASRPNAPSITPVTVGAVVLACGFGTGGTSQTTMTTPSGMTNGISYKHDGATYDGVVSVASVAWTSGAYDPAAWTGGTTSTADSWAAASVAIRPYIAPSLVDAPFFTNSNVIFDRSINSSYIISSLLVQNTNIFYSETITPGAIVVGSPEFISSSEIFSLTIKQPIVISVPFVLSSNEFYTPLLSTINYASLPIVINSNEFYDSSVSTVNNVLCPITTNSNSFYGLNASTFNLIAFDFLQNNNFIYNFEIHNVSFLPIDLTYSFVSINYSFSATDISTEYNLASINSVYNQYIVEPGYNTWQVN